MPARPGVTLLEVAVALAVAGTLAAVTLPPALALLDGARVRAARTDLVNAFAAARLRATVRGAPVAVALDPDAGTVRVEGAEVRVVRPLAAAYGVTLDCTRDSMVYAPSGLGAGAANLRAIVARGRVADTVWISRLGRVRSSS